MQTTAYYKTFILYYAAIARFKCFFANKKVINRFMRFIYPIKNNQILSFKIKRCIFSPTKFVQFYIKYFLIIIGVWIGTISKGCTQQLFLVKLCVPLKSSYIHNRTKSNARKRSYKPTNNRKHIHCAFVLFYMSNALNTRLIT